MTWVVTTFDHFQTNSSYWRPSWILTKAKRRNCVHPVEIVTYQSSKRVYTHFPFYHINSSWLNGGGVIIIISWWLTNKHDLGRLYKGPATVRSLNAPIITNPYNNQWTYCFLVYKFNFSRYFSSLQDLYPDIPSWSWQILGVDPSPYTQPVCCW